MTHQANFSQQERTAIMNIVVEVIQATPKPLTLQDDVLIDTDEASNLTKIPKASLIKDRCTGQHKIPFVRIGRSIKYRTTDLRAYIESHTHNKIELA